jgi:small subunit ribosomal protein S15
MALTAEQKQTVREHNQLHDTDTGSTIVQIAALTLRVTELTEHLKANPKDFACRRGLIMMVGRRRRFLRYYKQKNTAEAYTALLERFGIRK